MSAAQYRALRKELLILRSDVERLELAQAGAELRQSITHFKWLKLLVPGVSGGSLGKSARNVNATLGMLVSQYPLLSSLASVVLAKPVRALLRASARPRSNGALSASRSGRATRSGNRRSTTTHPTPGRGNARARSDTPRTPMAPVDRAGAPTAPAGCRRRGDRHARRCAASLFASRHRPPPHRHRARRLRPRDSRACRPHAARRRRICRPALHHRRRDAPPVRIRRARRRT